MHVGPGTGDEDGVVAEGQPGGGAGIVTVVDKRETSVGHHARSARFADVDNKAAVVRVGYQGIAIGHLHVPHVHPESVKRRELDPSHEMGISRVVDVEDFEPMASSVARISRFSMRQAADVVARGDIAVVAPHVDAVSVAFKPSS